VPAADIGESKLQARRNVGRLRPAYGCDRRTVFAALQAAERVGTRTQGVAALALG